MSQDRIRTALETVLSTWAAAQSPAIPVAWENVEFTQPEGRYLRAFLLPAQTISADIGRANRRYAGVFQVSVVMPLGDGPVPAEVIVASLAALFPPATPIVQSGLTVWIKDPLSPSPAITERDRYRIPCSLSYLADTY